MENQGNRRGDILPDHPQQREDLERHWKEQWMSAKLALETQRANVESLRNEVSLGADGALAYNTALAHETAALVEYSRILRIYTDLMVYGILPDEDRSGRSLLKRSGTEGWK